MSSATTPTTPHRTTRIREVTPETIDPSTYQPLKEHQERYYLIALVDDADAYLAIYATADGKRVTTPRFRTRSPPHALSITIGVGPHYSDRLATSDDALADMVARAHPEVPA